MCQWGRSALRESSAEGVVDSCSGRSVTWGEGTAMRSTQGSAVAADGRGSPSVTWAWATYKELDWVHMLQDHEA